MKTYFKFEIHLYIAYSINKSDSCVSDQQTQYTQWKKAIKRSIGWNRDTEDDNGHEHDFDGF